MTKRRTLLLPVAAAALVAAATAGCGSGGSSSPASSGGSGGPSQQAGGTSGGSQTPAPVESNPAGDIPDNQAYVAFQPAGGGFTVKVPEGWARTVSGSVTSFTDKLNGIEVAPASAAAAPTAQSVTSQVVPALQGKVPAFTLGQVSTVGRKGGQAVLLTYQGNSAPDPVTGKIVRDAFERYAFFRAGHEVDVTVSAPVGADNVDPWRIVTDSFAWQ